MTTHITNTNNPIDFPSVTDRLEARLREEEKLIAAKLHAKGWRKRQIEDLKAAAELHAGDGGYEEGKREDYEAFTIERNKSLMFDFHEAIRRMHDGAVVQYFGTVNGDVYTLRGIVYCMQRGVVFLWRDGKAVAKSWGSMVYDPDFRYIDTYHRVDPRGWPEEKKKHTWKNDIKKMTGYSRVGLNNV